MEKFEFKKVELQAARRNVRGFEKIVRVYKERIVISPDMVEKMHWKPGDRVDLLQCGTMFALERRPVGLFYLGKLNKESKAFSINSTSLCSHLRAYMSNPHDENVLEARAWVDGDRLIFKQEVD